MITYGSLTILGSLVQHHTNARHIAVITSKHVWDLHSGTVCNTIDAVPIIIPDGELGKDLSAIGDVYRQLLDVYTQQNDVLVALGDSSVGDAAGFVAATYKRGLQLISVPTTLLAQFDACCSSKNSINFQGIKNVLGVMHHPVEVLIDTTTILANLPEYVITKGNLRKLNQ